MCRTWRSATSSRRPDARSAEVLAASAEPMVHHRGPDFRDVYARTLSRLKDVYRTESDVLLFTSVGHGGDGIRGREPDRGRSAGRRGEPRVLRRALGRNWRTLRARCAKRSGTAGASPPTPAEVGAAVRESGAEIVFCQQSDTSTGVVADVLGSVRRSVSHRLVVDAISSLGAVPLETDAWGIDVVISGSQKALMSPPGHRDGVGARSRCSRSEAAAPPSTSTGGQTRRRKTSSTQPSHPPSRSSAASTFALGLILDDGLEAAFERHIRPRPRRARLREGDGTRAGSRPDDDGARSSPRNSRARRASTPTRLLAPPRDRHGVTLAPGQAQLKGKIFRIGHMRLFDVFDIATALAAIELSLNGARGGDRAWRPRLGAPSSVRVSRHRLDEVLVRETIADAGSKLLRAKFDVRHRPGDLAAEGDRR